MVSMKQIDVKSLVNYVALKVLGGNDYLLNALEEYLVKGEGPATVAYRYNISKHQLRGYAQRIIEKSGGEPRARKVVPILKEISRDLKPLVRRAEGNIYTCEICNLTLSGDDAEEHVKESHKDVLALAIKNMMERIERIRQELKAKKAQVLVTN